MQTAVHLPDLTLPGGAVALPSLLADTAQVADAGGVAALTLMDHYFQMETLSRAEDPMLEGYTTLGYLAARTQRLQLGLLVTGVTYRHPGLLAKVVTTLDVLSGGRAMLGLGAAWYEREHRGLGVPFPPTGERFDRLEEALQVCRQMWSDEDGPFDGKHYQLGETLCVPRPLQTPRPPILVGGGGERRTLRLVAQYADACNIFDSGPENVAHKLEVLDRHCHEVGRDPAEVQRTLLTGADPFEDGFLVRMEQYSRLGIERVWFSVHRPDPVGWTRRLTEEVVPRLQAL
jgi:F420-dependent oxidoreductase-like protein